MFPTLPESFLLLVARRRGPPASRPFPYSNLELLPSSYCRVCRFVRLYAEQSLHVLSFVIALVPDLREGQHTCVTVMLQSAFADAEQSANVSVMQPIRVFRWFSESLQATCGEAQHFVTQTLPICLCNNQILHDLMY